MSGPVGRELTTEEQGTAQLILAALFETYVGANPLAQLDVVSVDHEEGTVQAVLAVRFHSDPDDGPATADVAVIALFAGKDAPASVKAINTAALDAYTTISGAESSEDHR